MRTVYRILAMLIAAGVVVQTALIGFALFSIVHKASNGDVYSDGTSNGGIAAHMFIGNMIIPVLALAWLIVSFFAGIPGGVKWAGITFGLIVVQVLLGYAGEHIPSVGILHVLNAFAIAATASFGMRQARLAGSPSVPSAAAGA